MNDIIEDAMIGHNKPPADAEQITDRLAEAHAEMVKRQADLLDALLRAPETVYEGNAGQRHGFHQANCGGDKKYQGRQSCRKGAVFERRPHRRHIFQAAGRPARREAQETLNARLTIYERDKADKERRVREEAARKEREEAQRLQAIADERERAAREVERAADTDAALDDAIDSSCRCTPSRCRCAPSRCRCRSCRTGSEGEGGATAHHARRLWIIQFASHFLGFYRPGQGRAGP